MYDFVMAQLAQSRGRWPEVADGSGVSKRTIEKIARREIESPNVHHVQRLADYFREQDAGRSTAQGVTQ